MSTSSPGQVSGIGSADTSALMQSLVDGAVQRTLDGITSGTLMPPTKPPGHATAGPDATFPPEPVIATINILGG